MIAILQQISWGVVPFDSPQVSPDPNPEAESLDAKGQGTIRP